MSGFTIRPYVPADVLACLRVYDHAWRQGHPYAPAKIDLTVFETNTKGETILVAETPEGVVAFVSVFEPESFVHHLYVEPSAQERGIGTALLAEAIALTGGRASLKCQIRNASALAFYRGLGWRDGEQGEGESGLWLRLLSPG